jgi:hypothetical protein
MPAPSAAKNPYFFASPFQTLANNSLNRQNTAFSCNRGKQKTAKNLEIPKKTLQKNLTPVKKSKFTCRNGNVYPSPRFC